MASVTFAVDEELNNEISKFPWINLSELARERLIKEQTTREAFEKFKVLVSKSKFTEKDAKELSDKINEGMLKRLKQKYPELL